MTWHRAKIWWSWAVRRYSPCRHVHFGDFVMLSQRELSVLGLERVDMNRSIRRLGRDVFVQRIPCYALHVVVVLGYLSDAGAFNKSQWIVPLSARYAHKALTVGCAVYPGDIVHTTSDEEHAIR